jgi:hypothetical protein
MNQAIGPPTAKPAHAASVARRLRRRAIPARTERERATALETFWLVAALYPLSFKPQNSSGRQRIEPQEYQPLNSS